MNRYFFILLFSAFTMNVASADGGCESGIQAFEKYFYPLLTAQCAQCHADGKKASTSHSSTDVKQAYENARRLISLDAPEKSKFMRKIREQHWSNYDLTAPVDVNESAFSAALSRWIVEGEVPCGLEQRMQMVSSPVALDYSNLKAEAIENLVYFGFDQDGKPVPVSDVDGAPLVFRLELAPFVAPNSDVPGAISIQSIKAYVKEGTLLSYYLSVKGIYLMVNGKVNYPENKLGDAMGQFVPGNGIQLLTHPMNLSFPKESSQFALQIGIEKAEWTRTPLPISPESLQFYQTNVQPIVMQKCLTCHSEREDFSEVPEEQIRYFKARDLMFEPMTSVIMQKIYFFDRTSESHRDLISAEEAQTFRDWLVK